MSRINGFSAKYISNVITLDWRNLIVDFLHFLRNYIYCLHDGAEFSKITPSFFTIKKGFFLPLRLSCKESSTSNQAFLLRRKDVNRPTVLYLPHLSLPSGRGLTLYPSPKSLP